MALKFILPLLMITACSSGADYSVQHTESENIEPLTLPEGFYDSISTRMSQLHNPGMEMELSITERCDAESILVKIKTDTVSFLGLTCKESDRVWSQITKGGKPNGNSTLFVFSECKQEATGEVITSFLPILSVANRQEEIIVSNSHGNETYDVNLKTAVDRQMYMCPRN